MAVIDDRTTKPVQQAGEQGNEHTQNRGGEDVMDVDSNNAASNEDRQVPPSPEEQATQISTLYETHGSSMGADQVWYLLSSKWTRAFRAFAKLDDNWRPDPSSPRASSPPTEIDNEPLVAGAIITGTEQDNDPFLAKVRATVLEGMDYELVPQQVWSKLHSWYGGGPAIARRTHMEGTKYKVDLHPYFVHVALLGRATDMSKHALQFELMTTPRKVTLKDLRTRIKKHFKLTCSDSDLRMFSAVNGSPYQRYSDDDFDKDVEEIIERPRGQQIVLEEKSATGWRIKAADDEESAPVTNTKGNAQHSILDKKEHSSKYSSGSSYTYSNSNNGDNISSEPGVCGLQNLGNTCFMNSALQCLTKTPVICDYFVKGDYAKEINRDNPLGMSGKIAEAFGNLMKDMFSGRHSYISPREFKHVIGKFAPQFSGYQQQDSQELIAYLLDGLHEDLNRILKKPPTEPVESKGRPDDEVADEAWKTHKLRNDSVIVDKFQGQLKSELVCPECNNVSITFDPFMYLSLPLPVERTRNIELTVYFYGNVRAPLKIQVSVNKGGYIDELRKAIADAVGIAKPQNIVVAEVFSNKIYRYFSDTMEIKGILDSDVVCAFEMREDLEYEEKIHNTYSSYENTNLPYASVRMTSTIKEEYRSPYSNVTTVNTKPVYLTHPFVIPFDKKQSTNKELYNHCLAYLKPYLKTEELEKLNIKLDDPESFLYKGPTEKQRLRMEQERERQRKQREKEEKERKRYYGGYGRYNSSDSDKMSDEEKAEEEPQQPVEEEEDQEPEPLILFTLRFEESSTYGTKVDSFEDVLPYNDNVVEIPRDKYSYSSDKKTLAMFVNPTCVENLIDQQKLKQVDLHDSIKSSSGEKVEKGAVSLDACLNLFTTREKLSSNDTWYCPQCKQHVEAYKKFDLWRLPEVLVVHLKRFQYNRYTRDKLETFIDYPLEGLDLSQHIQHNLGGNPNCKYDLFAVSNHYGGLGGGHYTAYAKIQRQNKWYKFDDSYTSPVNPESVKTSSGYVLFYKLANPPSETANRMDSDE